MPVEARGMSFKVGVWSCAAVTLALCGPGLAAAAPDLIRPDQPVEAQSVQALDGEFDQGPALPPKVAEALEGYRRAEAEAGQGHPVMYGNGQCYPLVEQYIHALGFPWRNHDPSPHVFDLYHHFPTNGLGEYFEQVPFAGGANAPQVGDIVVYGPGGYVSEHGHAAVVTAVHDGALFGYETADQNAGGRLFVTLNWRDFSPMWNTLGYLRPKL
ncbi:CHAP domain-containing protein [Mycolicibacter minnesotensis]